MFAPWIRLFTPTGEFVGEGYSQLGGKIDYTAPAAGTYTVVVASADAIYAETGSYLLTLAKRGPFAVPTNDEGGPMANGVVYRAAITRADLDQWAFQATAGQPLSISAAELGGNSGFFPWIRLYAPNGALHRRVIRPDRRADQCGRPGDRLYTRGCRQRGWHLYRGGKLQPHRHRH